ncbi:MAG: hypothetical protein HY066_14060 [Betaproteobacteria bacterium]|nr:hypothetical protein [Betaproteobacteria bacterium]
MTKRNRKTLTDNFADGKLPTQEAFGDLIDSMVNIVDDGFDKSAQDGMKVAQLGNSSKLISFYDEITVKTPLWSIAFSMSGYGGGVGSYKNLNFFYGNNNTTGLTLASAAGSEAGEETVQHEKIRMGINKNNPEYEVDVNGVVASDGRIGREGGAEKAVRADGKWHPVITGLDGCQAFEIMAGVGKKNNGRYALLHAFALNTFNSKKGNITYHQAHFSSRCDQIDLRWVGETHNYSLEMRTRCSFEQNADEEVCIRYFVTQLWFDPFMESCLSGPNSKSGAER